MMALRITKQYGAVAYLGRRADTLTSYGQAFPIESRRADGVGTLLRETALPKPPNPLEGRPPRRLWEAGL